MIDYQTPPLLGTPITTISTNQGTKKNMLLIQKLTVAQVQEHKKKGLCFHCDEKYHEMIVC